MLSDTAAVLAQCRGSYKLSNVLGSIARLKIKMRQIPFPVPYFIPPMKKIRKEAIFDYASASSCLVLATPTCILLGQLVSTLHLQSVFFLNIAGRMNHLIMHCLLALC
jgi:hypothetical protein